MSSVFALFMRRLMGVGRELPRRHELAVRIRTSHSLSLIYPVLPAAATPPPPHQSQYSHTRFNTITTPTPYTSYNNHPPSAPCPIPAYDPFDIPFFADPMPAIATTQQVEAPQEQNPTFSPKDASVIFVLGGPGAGKGTQCANLVRDYGFVHLSAGDLLREEQNRAGSEFGELIKTYIREGNIVPMEVTVALLENAMKDAITKRGKRKFLIDGFPRKLDQAYKFENEVCPSTFTLFFDCTEDVMLERLLKRGETSGRADDNIESIKKRFRTFKETSYPVVEYFRGQGKVVDVDAADPPDGVYAHVREQLKDVLGEAELGSLLAVEV